VFTRFGVRFVVFIFLSLAFNPVVYAQPDQEATTSYLLVAHPDVKHPGYSRSVILVMAHMEKNAIGVILNKPMPVMLEYYFPDEPVALKHQEPVFYGGAFSKNAYTFLINSQTQPKPTLSVIEDYWLGVDSQLLYKALDNQIKLQKIRIFKGFSSWAPGQLESEINHGLWYILPAQTEQLLSDSPELMWQTLIDQINRDWI